MIDSRPVHIRRTQNNKIDCTNAILRNQQNVLSILIIVCMNDWSTDCEHALVTDMFSSIHASSGEASDIRFVDE